MFDLEMMRRASIIGALTPEELTDVRGYREGREESGSDLEGLESSRSPAPQFSDEQVAALISEEAKLLVIGFEVSDKNTYERKYIEPEWPGGDSGITIGIGYDIGYHTRDEVRKHWTGLLSDSTVAMLCEGVGLKGQSARQELPRFGGIRVPWDTALEAYRRSIMPKYGRLVIGAFPNSWKLHGHCFGALFSLVFNRGAAMSDGKKPRSREEMRRIRDLLLDEKPEEVPAQIIAMKRIWLGANLSGLLKRRDAEAALFQRGLEVVAAQVQPPPLVAAPASLESTSEATVLEASPNPELDGDGQFYEESDAREGTLEATPSWDQVRWPKDDNVAPDYSHIVDRGLSGMIFEVGPAEIELLLRANSFEPNRDHGRIVFALRGVEMVTSEDPHEVMPRQEDRPFLTLRDVRPNHKDFKCLIGIYNVGTGRLWGFTSSTVPNRKAVASYFTSKKAGNMMPTGCYPFEIGWHLAAFADRKIPGCLIENGRQKAVLRSTNDLSYDLQDTWENHRLHGDNVHPAKIEASASFSSWGCLVVSGNYLVRSNGERSNGTHTGEWGRFRQALGLARAGTADHGKKFDVVLLTGLDAAIANHLIRNARDADPAEVQKHLGRLRQGSRGERVKVLQKALGVAITGILDHKTAKALADRQKAERGQNGDGIYSPAMDAHFQFEVFAAAPMIIAANDAAATRGPPGSLESLKAKSGDVSLEALYYEIGLLARASQHGGGATTGGDFESISAAQLEFSFASLKDFGRSIVDRLEQQLHELVCGPNAGTLVDGTVRTRLDELASRGSSEVRRYLVSLLTTAAVFVPPSIIEKVVDAILERVLSATRTILLDGATVTGGTLCKAWSVRLGPAGSAPVQIIPVAEIGGASPQPKPTPPPTSSSQSEVDRLISQIERAAAPPDHDPAAVRRLVRDLKALLDQPGEQIDDVKAKRVITALSGTFIDQIEGAAGEDPYQSIADLRNLLDERPLQRPKIATLLNELDATLANARVKILPDQVSDLLKGLRGAKLFDEMSRLADRLITRDKKLLGLVAKNYAQGLIESGRLIAGLQILETLIDPKLKHEMLTPAEAADATGVLGRAHKQIYVNYIKSPADAVALGHMYGEHLECAIDAYGSQYDPAKPGENYYQGINLIALLRRARQDRIKIKSDADHVALARNMIKDLEPKARGSNDPWLLATMGEAYLATSEDQKAAEYFAAYTKHPEVNAFALNGTIRQLEEVWQFCAGVDGPCAIVTGLKSTLATMEKGHIRLSSQDCRALANAQGTQFQEMFETRIDGGKFMNFFVLKRIVQCGAAVTAIQRRVGQMARTVGTGFLVKGSDFSDQLSDDKSYVLTNAHVVWDTQKGPGVEENALMPGDANIVFENDLIDGKQLDYKCVEVLWQSPSSRHDCALLELDRKVSNIAPLELAPRDIPLIVAELPKDGTRGSKGTRLAVLGHPQGGNLAISSLGSLDETEATLVDKGPRGDEDDPYFLHYRTPTEPGNSGSPVFDMESWRVVGLHHAGFNGEGRPKLSSKKGTNLANEGIFIESIRAAIRKSLAGRGRPTRGKWFGRGT